MKNYLLIPCLILCSCFSSVPSSSNVLPSSSSAEDIAGYLPIVEGPTEGPESWRAMVMESRARNARLASRDSSILPSSSSAEPKPSIDDCPPEDIAEYPIRDEPTEDFRKKNIAGKCWEPSKASKEEITFGVQGGVRCVTTDRRFAFSDAWYSIEECIAEDRLVGDYYAKIRCTWITVTRVNERVLHISVNKNETKEERKLNIKFGCKGSVIVTQSAE